MVKRSRYKGKEYSNIEIDLINRKIKLPKLSLVKIRGYRNLKEINGRIINATIERELTNKYYVRRNKIALSRLKDKNK